MEDLRVQLPGARRLTLHICGDTGLHTVEPIHKSHSDAASCEVTGKSHSSHASTCRPKAHTGTATQTRSTMTMLMQVIGSHPMGSSVVGFRWATVQAPCYLSKFSAASNSLPRISVITLEGLAEVLTYRQSSLAICL